MKLTIIERKYYNHKRFVDSEFKDVYPTEAENRFKCPINRHKEVFTVIRGETSNLAKVDVRVSYVVERDLYSVTKNDQCIAHCRNAGQALRWAYYESFFKFCEHIDGE